MPLLLFTLAFISVKAGAEVTEPASRPVTSEYRLEIGRGSALSTYLSPLKYSGKYYAFTGQWSKALPANEEHLTMTFNGGAAFRDMMNPARTAQMLGIDGRFSWGMDYRWRLPYNIQVASGGRLDFDGGALYLTRNGNNPVSVLASAGLSLNASASWHFMIGRLPVLLRDEFTLPTLSAFFSPDYGETYFEIYVGNRKGLAHCGWWGNKFGADNLLSATLDFGRTALEVGYRYSISTAWVNQLNTRVISHSFVIGVIPQGIGLKRKRNANFSIY